MSATELHEQLSTRGRSDAEPALSLDLLRRLRSRHRTLRATDGAIRIGILLLLIVWTMFLLDWTLDLPFVIRAVNLLAAVVVMSLGVRFFLVGSKKKMTDSRLALMVEGASGGFDEALITAVQLADPANPHRSLYSQALLGKTIATAERGVAEIRARELLSRRGAFYSAGMLGCLLVSQLLLAYSDRDLPGTWFLRDILLQNDPWPRQENFDILSPTEEVSLLALGDPLTVEVKRTRGSATKVSMSATYLTGEKDSISLDRKGEKEFKRVFRNVSRGFTFRIEGGDYRSQVFTVEVRNRPRIESIAMRFDYPDYTGLDDVTEPTNDFGGHVKVPQGTKVSFEAATSIPISRVVFHRVTRQGGKETVTDEELALVDGTRFSGGFVADDAGHYFFRLLSEDGFENPHPIRYRIGLIQDTTPSVQITKPGKTREVSKRAHLPIVIEAQDDYGIIKTELVFRTASDEGDAQEESRFLLALQPIETAVRTGSRRRFELAGTYELDLEVWGNSADAIPIKTGERIEYFAESIDAIGQIGSSRTYVLTIVREEDLARIIQDELTLIRDRLEQALKFQRDTRSVLNDVLDSMRLAGDKLPSKSIPLARHVRLGQERISTKLDDNLDRLEEVIARVTDNRLLSLVKDLPWITELRDTLADITDPLAIDALSAVDAVVKRASAGSAQVSDVQEAIRKQRAVENALSELVDELGEWGDIRTMIRKLEELIDVEESLEKDIKARLTKQSER